MGWAVVGWVFVILAAAAALGLLMWGACWALVRIGENRRRR